MPEVLLKFSCMYLVFVIALFCIHLRKWSLIWVTFGRKLRLGTSRRAISSLFYVSVLIYYLLWDCSLNMLSRDIKTNPGSIPTPGQCFSICHWHLNRIAPYNSVKLFLLNAYNLVHSFDIICLSETYLNSETPPNNTCLELPGRNLFHSDHPSNSKRGGVCIYYKSTIPENNLSISNLN